MKKRILIAALILLAFGIASAHSHSWLLESTISGQDAYGNPTKICNWRCASDRNHTTTTSGAVCSYPY